jgi:esterase/lipase
MMKRVFLVLIASLMVIYFIGPRPKGGQYNSVLPKVLYEGIALDQWIQVRESRANTKPDNQARIMWVNDTTKAKTKYAVVYLHGFSASQEEGDPVHINFAKHINANLYLSRLSDHGLLAENSLSRMTATSLWESAKEAYAIGKKLGDSVILVGTSTGGTLAVMLAAEHYPELAGMVLMSPNAAINEQFAFLLNDHWGLHIARAVKGGDDVVPKDTTARYKKYWYSPYRLEGAVELEQLIEDKMNVQTFAAVTQPVLMMYYFKDENNQDPVVKVPAMLEMFKQFSSPTKKQVPIPNAGDHVIGSYIKSKDWQAVQKEALEFADTMHWTR